MGGRRSWRILIFLTVWAGLIFGTSCTVIRPNEFFELIASTTGADQESMSRFSMFWGAAWFAIVKGWHVTEFAILTLLMVWGLEWWRGHRTVGTIAGGMLLTLAFAASDEWHQSFVPDRFGTIQDVMIDSLGICVAGVILAVRGLRVQRKRDGEECRE